MKCDVEPHCSHSTLQTRYKFHFRSALRGTSEVRGGEESIKGYEQEAHVTSLQSWYHSVSSSLWTELNISKSPSLTFGNLLMIPRWSALEFLMSDCWCWWLVWLISLKYKQRLDFILLTPWPTDRQPLGELGGDGLQWVRSMKVTCWLLLLSALQLVQGHLVLTRERREVGPVTGPVTGGHKKYRRLQHSIMVQADIRSRSGQPCSKYIVSAFYI